MFDTIFGLPVHPLVVHGVVVLLPLSALGVIAISLVPSWRRRYGVLVVLLAAAATAAVPVATRSGRELAQRVGTPERHAELGSMVIWYAVPMLLLAGALVWLDRRQAPPARGYAASGSARNASTAVRSSTQSRLVLVVAGLAIVAAVGAAWLTVLTGHAGSKAVWEPIVQSTED
ncbi:MAG: DUF2231 domain-containing protein [Candidatus Nanopelagicales bacterium]